MLAPLPCVEAFRRDAVSIDGVSLDDGIAASWLESATRLERAAMTRDAERERLLIGLLARQDVVQFPATPISRALVAATVTKFAADIEDRAYFRLAHSVLSTLLAILPPSEFLLRGRVIAVQARLARQLGENAASARYYQEVEQLGAEHAAPELTGRASLGFAILARIRGDFQSARRYLAPILELEGAAPETVGYAHHELMVMAVAASDYDTAAQHGWFAYKGASTSVEETEALFNLAQLLLEAGHPRAALRGFAAALARKPILRDEIPILGGAGCAAAASLPTVAARALVRNFAERLEDLAERCCSVPHLVASSMVELSEALTVVGDEDRAERMAQHASDLANKHGFYQLLHRLENPVFVAPPAPLSPATQEIIAAVDELDGAELVAAV
ncbi:MAG TPA: hypothetical protein VGJ18_07335 [Gemmatimonadaceae bacterium]